jgi:hypothetical protein
MKERERESETVKGFSSKPNNFRGIQVISDNYFLQPYPKRNQYFFFYRNQINPLHSVKKIN